MIKLAKKMQTFLYNNQFDQLKFYKVAELLRFNQEYKLVDLKNTSKIYDTLKMLDPKFDELRRKYFTTQDLLKVAKIRNYKNPYQKQKICDLVKLLKTTRTTLYTKFGYNLELKNLVKANDNWKHIDKIKELFKLKRK